jgi:hypothetical protein
LISRKGNSAVISAIAALIAYSLLVLVMITVIRVPGAGGHEISIYDVYPMYFWLPIIYNHKRYIVDATRSVSEQDNADMELIIVGDGSKDSSAKIRVSQSSPDLEVLHEKPEKTRKIVPYIFEHPALVNFRHHLLL